jgi:hypothetical protein
LAVEELEAGEAIERNPDTERTKHTKRTKHIMIHTKATHPIRLPPQIHTQPLIIQAIMGLGIILTIFRNYQVLNELQTEATIGVAAVATFVKFLLIVRNYQVLKKRPTEATFGVDAVVNLVKFPPK